MTTVERVALVLTALPFLTLGLAHYALRRLALRPGKTLIAAVILMLRQIGRLAGWVTALYTAIWAAGKYLDPAAFEAFWDEPISLFVLMGSAMLAYLYLFIRWCWQLWQSRRRALRELAK
ncbi:hypothetical protein [Paracoccus zhejiangensis]|uniref:Uncharacterized protein n=1 Tax=Paracoccus zhejiangensis TaxID=1077935 RepID=A0A2H5F2Q7_9RHOB|nr:hypothetical protein [Paracoccus zhejiangensis]AUH65840.1 hypothetical protein CX676_18140 [Paracoccus zhejiangensis]